mmetsp:Transcript_79640/g.138946  ORF Transcript_79640/g.138946 Transcript_79640/m.138946 type:complete len:330 (-) Transcript_79640:245-1234(-)
MASVDHRAILVSKLAEKLASKGLDDEIIEDLMELEKASLRRLGGCEVIKMPAEVRLFVLSFLQTFSSNDPVSCYLNTVQLFDLAARRTLGNDASPKSVMALAAAAWMVSAKLMSMEGPHYSIAQVVEKARAFAGFPVMSCNDIQQKEKTFLLSFNISAPTVSTWYDLFSARLDAILDGALEKHDHLQQLQNAYVTVVSLAMQNLEVSEMYPAYTIASGSFCFALAVLGLVPVADVMDASLLGSAQMPDMASVEATLAWIAQGFFSGNPASPPPAPAPAILAATQVALHSSPKSMRLATSLLVAHIRSPPPAHSQPPPAGTHARYAESLI